MGHADVICQAPLLHGHLFGIADFIVRRGPLTGENAQHGFAIWETKLAKKASPEMLIQVGCYADALQAMVGGHCHSAGLVLGELAAAAGQVENYNTAELLPKVRTLWADFLSFHATFDPNGEMPDPGEAHIDRKSVV